MAIKWKLCFGIWIAFASLAIPREAYAIGFDEFCKGISKPDFPKDDFAKASEEKNLDKCDAYDLLHGVSQGIDLAGARKCALLHISRYNSKHCTLNTCDLFFDAEALVEIYANGSGVKKNMPMARAVACHYGTSYFEEVMDALNAPNPPPLDICSRITGAGPSGGAKSYCDSYTERKQRKAAKLKPAAHTKCPFSIAKALQKGDEITDQLKVDENNCIAVIYSEPSPSDREEDIIQGSFAVYLIHKDKATSKVSKIATHSSHGCSEAGGRLEAFIDKQGRQVYEASGTLLPCEGGNGASHYNSRFRINNGKFEVLK